MSCALKEQFTPKSKQFWCELLISGDISCRKVDFLTNILELDGTLLRMLKTPQKIPMKNSTVMSLYRNYDLVIQRSCCELFSLCNTAQEE